MAGNRKEPRLPKKVQVRVWGMDAKDAPFQQTVTTVNLSRGGARLEGLHCLKGPGETIGIQCGKERARFKVIWLGESGSPLWGHVGVQSLEPEKHIWGVDLPLPRPDHFQPPQILPADDPFAPAAKAYEAQADERRKGERYPCAGQAEVRRVGEKASFTGLLADISSGGCYVQWMAPLEEGARVEMVVTAEGAMFRTFGVVRTSHPAMGMGVAFQQMNAADRRVLDNIIRKFAGQPPLPELPPEPIAPAAPTTPAVGSAPEVANHRLEAFDALPALEILLELLDRKGVISREEFWAALDQARQTSRR